MQWHKSIKAISTCGNIDTSVLIRCAIDEEGVLIITTEALIPAYDNPFHWIDEIMTPASYKQAQDIIMKFDGMCAINFLDRVIEAENLQF